MSNLLVIVDCQNDFVDGVLGTAEAERAMEVVSSTIKDMGPNDLIYFTQDTHQEDYLETQEGKLLPIKHCIQGTEGWKISNILIDELGEEYYNKLINRSNVGFIQKNSFGYKDWGKMHCFKPEHRPDKIYICGLCTDICVISNALIIKSVVPEIPITLITAACAGVTPERHMAALKVMSSCQIDLC